MKKLIYILMLSMILPLFGNFEDWTGKWVVSYNAYFNDGWTFQKVEFSSEGNVYVEHNGRMKVCGQWEIEQIIPKGSPLFFRLFRFEIWENEFVILYNHVKRQHEGQALVSDNNSHWAMNPIEFEIKRIAR